MHADGEIWSATNFRVRQAFVNRYGQGTPSLQLSCAEGRTDVQACPGNRRWIQLMFDSFLLQSAGAVSMLDMRDNMLAADLVRFGGADQDIIWNAFAASGMGQDASTNGGNDTDATPSFASPFANNATVRLLPTADAADAVVRLYVGDYEARAVPIADTDPETAIPDTFQIIPGQQFSFVATGAGFGARRFTTQFIAGRSTPLVLNLPRNLASTAAGATVTGDGVNLDAIADDTEATDWASLDGVADKQVTIDLAGTAPQRVTQVSVSRAAAPGHRRQRRPGPAEQVQRVAVVPDPGLQRDGRGLLHRRRLHPGVHQPGERVPGAGVPAGRAGPEPAPVQHPADASDRVAAAGAVQPVHRQPAVRG